MYRNPVNVDRGRKNVPLLFFTHGFVEGKPLEDPQPYLTCSLPALQAQGVPALFLWRRTYSLPSAISRLGIRHSIDL